MRAVIEFKKSSEVKRLKEFVKDNKVSCSIKVSNPARNNYICQIETDDNGWKMIKGQLVRHQLMFDYYEDNEYIAPPFKEIYQGY